MWSLPRLARPIVVLAVLLAVGADVLLSLIDPGALAVTAPFALALGFLLTGRRRQNLALVLAGDACAIAGVILVLTLSFRHPHS